MVQKPAREYRRGLFSGKRTGALDRLPGALVAQDDLFALGEGLAPVLSVQTVILLYPLVVGGIPENQWFAL